MKLLGGILFFLKWVGMVLDLGLVLGLEVGTTRMGWKWDRNILGSIPFRPRPNLECSGQLRIKWNKIDNYAYYTYTKST